MKTLVFSENVSISGIPKGILAQFKMLHLETGILYNYRVFISQQRHQNDLTTSLRDMKNNLVWREKMFYALTHFIERYNTEYGSLPSPGDLYHDGRAYTCENKVFGKKIRFIVPENSRRALAERQFRISDPLGIISRNSLSEQ